MTHIFRPLTIWSGILILAILSGCANQQQSGNAAETPAMDYASDRPAPAGETVPVGYCRVEAEVVSIDPAPDTADPESPCATAPCRAEVRIIRIIGTGAAFTPMVTAGSTVAVRFATTTAATEALFPEMERHYPGVTVGERIVTDLAASPPAMGQSAAAAVYAIHAYTNP